MNKKFQALAELGAGDFDHLNGSLIDHLNATKALLVQWGAPIELQDAGLYHAAYGTAGFSHNLVSPNQRDKISVLIGSAAEEIVYHYCACDRTAFFSRIGKQENPVFTNRFTGNSYHLSDQMLRYFCELTAANETEIAIDNAEFVELHGKGLCRLFNNMAPHLSAPAQQMTAKIFGSVGA